jgi:cytochrome b
MNKSFLLLFFKKEVLVWDLGLRGCHWLLAGAATVAAGGGFLQRPIDLRLHLVAGAAVAALVCFRLVWGVLGPTYARFAAFPVSLRAIGAHLGARPRHLGHNPLGSLMALSLLAVFAGLVVTGLTELGGVFKQGPLAAFASFDAGRAFASLHTGMAVLLLGLVALHLGGVGFESWRGGENLAWAMVTGRKRASPEDEPVRPASSHPRLAAAVCLCGLTGATAAVAGLSALPGRVPPATLSPRYVAACDGCHMAYPPELLPARSWVAIVATLAEHFGEDASLDAEQTGAVAAYLRANAAERWDTLAAHLFRPADPTRPTMISATPGWRQVHRRIPAATFAAKAVGSASACDACHRDAASGRFAPQAVAIPAGPVR